LKLPLDTFIAVSSPHEATIDAIQPMMEALTSAGYTSVIETYLYPHEPESGSPLDLVQKQTTGNRGIERVETLLHGNAHQLIAERTLLGGEPTSFFTYHQQYACIVSCLVE